MNGYDPHPPRRTSPGTKRERELLPTWLLLVLAAMLGVAGSWAIKTVVQLNTEPATTTAAGNTGAKPKPDSGIQACEQLRDNPDATAGKNFTQQRYNELRQRFAGSRDAAIREHGVKMVDLAWKIGTGGGAPESMTLLMGAATELRVACAAHGVVLPNS